MSAGIGDRVHVHYTGTLEDGTEFDSSRNGEPFSFVLGSGQVIAGFDHAVQGMEIGTTKHVVVSPEEGYGVYNDQYILHVSRSDIPPNINPEIGMELMLHQGNDITIPVRVTEMDEEHVVLDANHPLAGKSLVFDIELISIDPR
ncbi:MAG: peptidylprolyl isomerase [Bacteroidota bacterium]|nr:peptidylprolyl isomerase [Bacteroidota bacterium]